MHALLLHLLLFTLSAPSFLFSLFRLVPCSFIPDLIYFSFIASSPFLTHIPSILEYIKPIHSIHLFSFFITQKSNPLSTSLSCVIEPALTLLSNYHHHSIVSIHAILTHTHHYRQPIVVYLYYIHHVLSNIAHSRRSSATYYF